MRGGKRYVSPDQNRWMRQQQQQQERLTATPQAGAIRWIQQPGLLDCLAMIALVYIALRYALPILTNFFKIYVRGKQAHPYTPFEMDIRRPGPPPPEEIRLLIDRSTFTDEMVRAVASKKYNQGTQAGYLSPASSASSDIDFVKV
ncbi:hypothetical protein FOL47_005419 [Perkinsus chesapeaki]|uniref:Uncharacterized protein n=1 Tax=Perkinsus chesapeaki TaxID=330153 RepID=A0A7J6MYJ1_PERCH|nr:hypothetical protein FOL47_005419 [Perkinsus chesapeaki]